MFKEILPQREFSRNVITLLTGTTIAQAIPIAISPILTRIYTPEDFGVLALFSSIAIIFGTIASAKYELAIILPEDDNEALHIAALSFLITFSLTIFLLVIAIIFNKNIVDLLGNNNISFWLYFIPLSVFLIGLFNVLNYYNTRQKNFKTIAQANVYKALTYAIVQVFVGLFKSGASGLISGQIISNLFANMKLLKNTIKDRNILKALSFNKMKILASRYKNFPKYSLFAALANVISRNVIDILVFSYFSVTTLGLYSLVSRVLGLPSSLIGNSISQVFYQEASKEKNETGKALTTFNSTIKKLILISFPSFLILFFVVEDLFLFVFGEEWVVAGKYSKILVPLFAIRFVVSPLSVMNQINLRNRLGMFWQFGLLFLYVLIMLVGITLHLSFEEILIYVTIIISLYYLLFLYLIYQHTK